MKQTIVLVERTDFSITAFATGELELTLKGPRQQRYRVDTSPDLATWSAMTPLTITNADGAGTPQQTGKPEGSSAPCRSDQRPPIAVGNRATPLVR